METATTIAPQRGQPVASPAPKRSRKRELVKVDWRTVAGKRLAELKRLFTAELTGSGREITPMLKLLVEQAASALVLAEVGRDRFMREGGDLSDLATIERRADLLIKRLGLVDKPAARPDDGSDALRAYLSREGRP